MNRDRVDGPIENFNDHNVREGLHALYALVRYRDSDRARELAESSIEFILQVWDPDIGWDRSGMESAHGIRWTRENTFITGIARAIGPLVKYYRATGYAKGPRTRIPPGCEGHIRVFFAGRFVRPREIRYSHALHDLRHVFIGPASRPDRVTPRYSSESERSAATVCGRFETNSDG